MSETKDISKKRLADFLAARLRAKRSDERRAQQSSTDSSSKAGARTEQTNAPIGES